MPNVGQSLADKVKECMDEADCLMPILTRQSIDSQWVNQEIGFAEALKKPIIPLVEKNLLDKLKDIFTGRWIYLSHLLALN